MFPFFATFLVWVLGHGSCSFQELKTCCTHFVSLQIVSGERFFLLVNDAACSLVASAPRIGVTTNLRAGYSRHPAEGGVLQAV